MGAGLILYTSIAVAQWQSSDQDAAAAARLHTANAIFIAQTQNSAATLTSLARLRAQQRDHGARVAVLYAAASLPQQAEVALAGAAPGTDTAPARLAIAHAYYLHGDNEAVLRILRNMANTLPTALAQQRAALLARVLIRLKRYDEAALPLAAVEQLGDLSALDHYNLGIAWLGAGADARGAGELDNLGRYRGNNLQRRALADQANLTLAYWLLDHSRAGQARRVLWRLPISSPLARKGMLALGWAEFLTTTHEQPLINFDIPACAPESPELWQDAEPLHKVSRNHCRVPKVVRHQGLLTAVPDYAQAGNKYVRAAAAWRAASAGGDARNPVIAEALVCLPYALAQGGDLAQAQTAYLRAVTRLDKAEQRRLAQTHASGADSALQVVDIDTQWRLRRIQVTLINMRTRLQQRIARLLANPKNRHAHEVAAALKDMRHEAAPGAALAQPTPLQRGQLRLALAALSDADPTNSRNQQRRLTILQHRVAAMEVEIVRALAAVKLASQTQHQKNLQRQSEHIRTYLRDARLAFADLARP